MKFTEYFDEKTCQHLEGVIEVISDKYEISPHVLEDIVIAEAVPTDDKKWPRHWLKGKRVDTFFENLDEMYIKAFGSCYPSNVQKVMDQWNTYAAMPVDRLKRIFEKEKAFRVKKVYTRSRYLKDIYVMLYMLKARRDISVKAMIKTTVRRIKDPKSNFTARVVWKWNKFGTDKDVEGQNAYNIGSKVKVLEDGKDDA